jgi:hypothetical protein
MKAIRILIHIAVTWGWIVPGYASLWSCRILAEEGVPDLLRGNERQFDFDFVSPVHCWIWITLIWMAVSSITSSFLVLRGFRLKIIQA